MLFVEDAWADPDVAAARVAGWHAGPLLMEGACL